MTAGVLARVPGVAAIVVGLGLASATLTLAADSTQPDPAPLAAAAPAAPAELVVPDVRRQAYVFAKGSLEQEGFAWRVEGAVPGYAANVVVSQTPAPGAKVVPDGAPVVVLRLSRNAAYEQEGTPENTAPYPGRPARLVGAAKPPAKKPAQPLAAAAAPKPKTPAQPAAKPGARTPAFAVPGAPKEPADEILLSARAKRLAAWVEAHPRPTVANVNHWLYQHSWLVTGARFGWSGGVEALRILVRIDRDVQARWGVGGKSLAVARAALAEVERRSRP